jgi:two-component system, NtrC family, response regulator AtoC
MTDLASHDSGAARHLVTTRALVIDDEALIRWSVAETLAMLDFEVEQAGDAASALDAIAQAAGPFDIVVLDLRLPDMADLTLLRRVRQLLPNAFVLLMTAFGTPEIVAEAMALGAHGVLTKPFALEELSLLLSQRGGGATP